VQGFFMKTLAERLKFLRQKKGFKSKSVAAQAMNMSYGTYQGYEYGLFPGRDNYKKIAVFYGCSLLWLRDGEGDPYPGVQPTGPGDSGQEKLPPASLYVKEGTAAFAPNAPGTRQAPAGPEIRISEALTMTAHVLESGTSYATALYLNIVQFNRAVSAEATISKCQDNIANLQAQVDALHTQVADLQAQVAGLTAPPASSDQQADSLEKEAM
jgi:transcriptional regulator with XRE-family HTH domain